MPESDADANLGKCRVKGGQGSDFIFMDGIPNQADDSAEWSRARDNREDEKPDNGFANFRKAAFERGTLLEFLGALRLRRRKSRAAMEAAKSDREYFAATRGAGFIFPAPIGGWNFNGTALLNRRHLRAAIYCAPSIFLPTFRVVLGVAFRTGSEWFAFGNGSLADRAKHITRVQGPKSKVQSPACPFGARPSSGAASQEREGL